MGKTVTNTCQAHGWGQHASKTLHPKTLAPRPSPTEPQGARTQERGRCDGCPLSWAGGRAGRSGTGLGEMLDEAGVGQRQCESCSVLHTRLGLHRSDTPWLPGLGLAVNARPGRASHSRRGEDVPERPGGSASKAAWALAALSSSEQPQSVCLPLSPHRPSQRALGAQRTGVPGGRKLADGLRAGGTPGGWSFRARGREREGRPGLWHYGLPGDLQDMGPSPASLFFPGGLGRPLARHLLHQSPAHPSLLHRAPAPSSFNQ